MSIRRSDRCEATTSTGNRCKLRTARSELCWIHLKSKYHLRIKPSRIPASGLGLYSTAPLKKGLRLPYKGAIVTNLPDDGSFPYALQIRRHPPTYINPVYTNDGFGGYANACKTSDRTKGYCTGNNGQLRAGAGLTANIALTRNVGKDKEIYVSYGRDYWRNH